MEPIIATLTPEDSIENIWPIVEALATDPRWRVRRAVATQLTPIAYHLRSKKDFLEQSFLPMVEDLLVETVHAVRNRTAVEFRALVHIMGIEIIGKRFLPLCQQLFDTKSNYLTRMTALHFLYFCSTAYEKSCPTAFIVANFTPYFQEALKDQVPNVKSQAIRYIVDLIKNKDLKGVWDKAFVKANFITRLQALVKDETSDREIIFQGTEGIKAIELALK